MNLIETDPLALLVLSPLALAVLIIYSCSGSTGSGTVSFFVTVTMQVDFISVPLIFAVIVACPSFIALTFPLESTVATVSSELDQSISTAAEVVVAIRSFESPTGKDSVDLSNFIVSLSKFQFSHANSPP